MGYWWGYIGREVVLRDIGRDILLGILVGGILVRNGGGILLGK